MTFRLFKFKFIMVISYLILEVLGTIYISNALWEGGETTQIMLYALIMGAGVVVVWFVPDLFIKVANLLRKKRWLR